jgi:ABC-type Fe3+-siderophore transport system permease subunit
MTGVSELTLLILIFLLLIACLVTLHFIFGVSSPVLIFLAFVSAIYFIYIKLQTILKKEE